MGDDKPLTVTQGTFTHQINSNQEPPHVRRTRELTSVYNELGTALLARIDMDDGDEMAMESAPPIEASELRVARQVIREMLEWEMSKAC